MGAYLETLVVGACVIAAFIIVISCCCCIHEHIRASTRAWVLEQEERVEIPDIEGDTSVDRGGLNREPIGDFNLPSRDAQYPGKQWDGRAWASSRDAESSQQQGTEQQYNMTRNVIIGELGHSGRQGGEYREKSTGDHNLPPRDAQYPGKQWDGRSWVGSRDPQSSQQQYIDTRNVREERLKAPVPSAPAVLELEKPRSSQSGQTCCVCMTQAIEIIFNCAHAATCEECSKSLCVCPICRADITSRNRIYISGI